MIPTPSVAKPANVPDAGESVEKNWVLNTSGTAVEEDEEVVPLDRRAEKARDEHASTNDRRGSDVRT